MRDREHYEVCGRHLSKSIEVKYEVTLGQSFTMIDCEEEVAT